MSDLYLEELVKRRKTGTDQALRYRFYRDLRGGHLYFSEISDRMGISVCQRGTGCGSYHKQGKEKTNGIL